MDSNLLPEEYYVIGDEAFVNTNQFLVPWSGVCLFCYVVLVLLAPCACLATLTHSASRQMFGTMEGFI